MGEKIGVLDFGSGTVKALIAEIEDDFVNILGFGEEKAKGIERGVAVKISAARKAIKNAIKLAESSAGESVSSYYVLVSHPQIKSSNEKTALEISSTPVDIEEYHLEKLKEEIKKSAQESGYEIIHVIPRYFILDGDKYYEPLGLVASKIEAEYHIVKLPTIAYRNVEKSINALRYKVNRILFPAYSASLAVLDEDDLESNILLLDLGHTTTGYLLYKEGSPYISGVIDRGGKNITEDLAQVFFIPLSEAERIKIENGYALAELVPEDEEVAVQDKEGNTISVKSRDIAYIVEDNLRNIVSDVLEALYKKGVDIENEIDEIVLVGGGAQTKGIKELFEELLPYKVRIGKPRDIATFHEKILSPSYAPLLGAVELIRLNREYEEKENPFILPKEEDKEIFPEELGFVAPKEAEKEPKGLFGKIVAFFKNIFSED